MGTQHGTGAKLGLIWGGFALVLVGVGYNVFIADPPGMESM